MRFDMIKHAINDDKAMTDGNVAFPAEQSHIMV